MFFDSITLSACHVNPGEKATLLLAGWRWKTPDSIYWAVNTSLMAAGFCGLSLVTGHLIRLLLALPERKRAFCCALPPPKPNSCLPSGARTVRPGCHFGFWQTCKASQRLITQLLACQLIFVSFRSFSGLFSRCGSARLMGLRITKLAQHIGACAEPPRRQWSSAVVHINKGEIKIWAESICVQYHRISLQVCCRIVSRDSAERKALVWVCKINPSYTHEGKH